MPRAGRPKGTTTEVRRRALALRMLQLEGFTRNEAERLLAVFEEHAATPLSVAIEYTIRRRGRRRQAKLQWADSTGDVADAVVTGDEEGASGGRAVRNGQVSKMERLARKLRKRVEAVSKAPDNLRKAQSSEWPPYDPGSLLGEPCRCANYWRSNVEGQADPWDDPEAPARMQIPPHRHCCKCGIAAIEGDPTVEVVIRSHPITLAPDFHGWACQGCLKGVLEALPPPPWEGLMDEVEILSDEENEELLR